VAYALEDEISGEIGRWLAAALPVAEQPLVGRDVDEAPPRQRIAHARRAERRGAGGDRAGEELGAAAAPVREETDATSRERAPLVLEQRRQADVQRRGVGVADPGDAGETGGDELPVGRLELGIGHRAT